ncbi:MAG: type III-B CRISPR module RAMP protein Cmr1 [Lentisphaerae bacterium]|jgi:CRISPR type III-B/RAMP module RAMP protein Cmr1|nr:type III-B CRISPR module RAMP protein Cmr1 [Lentisphaerota bacterium]
MSSYKITFITPLFSRGALDTPEIRPSSIRGQLHWWFRAVGGSYQEEKAVFGGVGKDASSSKVVVRVSDIHGVIDESRTLPHKSGGMAAPREAYQPGTSFILHISMRLGGFKSDQHKERFEQALEAWLLLGTLGLRSTRAAGSFVWEPCDSNGKDMPETIEDYASRCRNVLNNAPLRHTVSNIKYEEAEDVRNLVSDTLGGRDDREGEGELARLRYPLGKAFGGRKTSPLRFRIVSPDNNGFYIAAVWDDRQEVTGNTPGDLEGIIRLLQQKKSELGNQLTRL